MITRRQRSAHGQSQREVLTIVGLGLILCYGYQVLNVYGAQILPPKQMVNKNFICGEAVRTGRRYDRGRVSVEASENPNTLVEWTRVSGLGSRFQPPDKAIENENKRINMMFGGQPMDIVDLSAGDDRSDCNSLVVHVMDTDNRAKDVPLLRVRPLNKRHKGETWYIKASSINREANVSDCAVH